MAREQQRQRVARWLASTEPTRGRRFVGWLGFGPEAWPYRRGWMARAGNPDWATSRWDRWLGVLMNALLLAAGVFVAVTHHDWFWRVLGILDALIAMGALVRYMRAIIGRRPLASHSRPPRRSC